MPGYSQIMRHLLPPAVIGLGVYKLRTYQEQQKYKQLLNLTQRTTERNSATKESIPKTNALSLALFVNICINHPAEIRTIIKSMKTIRGPDGHYQFEPLNDDSLKTIATKLQSGAELDFQEFMLYCRMLPAYRNARLYSELHFENYIPSELEEQYPGLDIKKILNDVEEKKVVFHQVVGPKAPFTLTAHECLLTAHQYKWHIIIQDAKTKEILQEVAKADSQARVLPT